MAGLLCSQCECLMHCCRLIECDGALCGAELRSMQCMKEIHLISNVYRITARHEACAVPCLRCAGARGSRHYVGLNFGLGGPFLHVSSQAVEP